MRKETRDRIKEKIRMKVIEKRHMIFSFSLMLTVMVVISFTVGRQLLEGNEPGLAAFGLINFLGYLFFILMPVEVLVPFYIREGHAGLTIILIAVSTALLAQLFDYAIGYLFSDKVIDSLIGRKRYERAERTIEKYGKWAVLFFNATPLSSPILVFTTGMVRMRWRTVFLYSLIGLVFKYTVLVYLLTVFG